MVARWYMSGAGDGLGWWKANYQEFGGFPHCQGDGYVGRNGDGRGDGNSLYRELPDWMPRFGEGNGLTFVGVVGDGPWI